MKTISTILAAVLCSASPLIAQEDAQDKSNTAAIEQPAQIAEQKLGKDAISSVRHSYEDRNYASFLKEMDDSYQEALSQNQLSGLVEMRLLPTADSVDLHKWEERASQILKERNNELLSLLSDKDDSLSAQKVRSAAANLSTSEQEAAISQLALFRQMAPGSGKNTDENRVIELDLEYEYKALHIYVDPSDEASTLRRERQVALKMEKMDKLVEASKNFQDPSLKLAIGLASANFDDRLSQSWDVMDLNAIAKGKTQASNDLEKKASSILSSYQGKYNELFKQYLDSQEVVNSEKKN